MTPVSGAGGVATVITGTVDAVGGDGGAGATDFAEAGSDGADATASGYDEFFQITNGGTGGPAGKAVNLSGGAVIWLSGNEPERVKGDVS